MTATEELRRLLDERGVEWTANDGEYVKETCWAYMGELTAAFAEYYDGTTRFACDTWCFTPEQAIDATLGRGACHIDVIDSGEIAYYCCNERIMHCNGCGHEFGHVLYDEDGNVWMSERPNYCPNCGREVRAGAQDDG